MSEAEKEYVPYGDEWRKEMMKLTKSQLIDFLYAAHMDLKQCIKELDEARKK